VTEAAIRPRAEIPPELTWNAPSVFESDAAWQAEFKRLSDSLPDVRRFQGRLGDSPAALADAWSAIEQLTRDVGKVFVYAGLAHSVDTADQKAAGMHGQAQGLYARAGAAVSFLDPELLAIGEDKLRGWLAVEPRLAVYQHYVDNLFRKQAHVRSAEVEELLGMLSDPFSGPSGAYSLLTDADFKFEPVLAGDGTELPVAQGTIVRLLHHPDREVRRAAYEHYTDAYLAHQHTLAGSLAASIKQNVFSMRARRHASTLEASLFDNGIPVEVFHNLIETFKKNLPTWHRYWAIRRKALGVDKLRYYDIWAPLTADQPEVTYPQAVDWICRGLAPMGEEYVGIVRKGCLQDRWVDVYPNRGKRAGAFSWGSPGTLPFIVMSYADSILSLSTLAHELGHSMHSYLTWRHQPVVYGDYSLFVAEVASNFHQALVRAYLLDRNADPAFQIGVIGEALANFHRYFLTMPTLARFELETHQRVERGEALTAGGMIDLAADLFAEAYGGELSIDRERDGILWATYGHLYADYYVYQYATGIAGAHALANRILSGAHGAVDDYLNFLKAGGSVYPLDALRMAGVDLATPQAVEETFAVLAGMVDRLEALLG
jgi:oligoendopeptidase F